MFRFVVVAFVISFGITSGAKAGILQGLGAIAQAPLSSVKVESPVLKQAGFKVEGSFLVLNNGTPFTVTLFAIDREVATLEPGEVAYAQIGVELLGLNWESLNQKVPLLAKAYFNGEHLGYGAKIITFSARNPRTESWDLKVSDIRSPEGRALVPSAYPPVKAAAPKTHKIKIPREAWNATALIQIVNNTLYRAEVYLNGAWRTDLGPGDIYFVRARETLGFQSQEVSIHLAFKNDGVFVGTYPQEFRVPSNGIVARQIVATPQNIRR